MQRHKICRYFQRGSCKKQKCPFVHLRQTRKNCQFFMNGFCRKGNNCNFYHPAKEKEGERVEKERFRKEIHKGEVDASGRKNAQQDRHNCKVEEKQKMQEFEVDEDEWYQLEDQKGEKEEQMIVEKEQQQHPPQKQEQAPHELTDKTKSRTIDFLLGLGSDNDSQCSQQNQGQENPTEAQQKQQAQQKQPPRKALNFIKVYPKKFPDYTKTAQSKLKILENEKKYFEGVRFADLLFKTTDPVQREFYQLVRKYQDSFTIPEPSQCQQQQKNPQNPVQNQMNSAQNQTVLNPSSSSPFPPTIALSVRPLLYIPQILLHFQMIQDSIQLIIHTKGYPQKRCQFEISNLSIPEEYKDKFVALLQRVHQGKGKDAKGMGLVDTLKYFCNHFQNIYQECKTVLENQHYSRIELQKKLAQKSQLPQSNPNPQRKPPKKPSTSSQNAPPAPQNPDVLAHRYSPTQKIPVTNLCYQLKIQSLHLTNIEYLIAQRFLLYLECHCQKKIIYILEADRKQLRIGIQLECRKCGIIIRVVVEREVMQLRANTIGRLAVDNGRLLEIGGVAWKAGCACDLQISKPRICLPGYRLPLNCQSCFAQMQVQYQGLYFLNQFLREQDIIAPNKQLPLRGTCKHNKLSFRWLRYACCGRKWSCGECHDAGAIYGHEKGEPATMVCGYCGIEQPVAKQCSSCRKELVKGVDKSGHWQGGLGCRDKALLSRKDGKKYAGLTKTHHKDKDKDKDKEK